jgi:hypothetical protein
MNRTIKAPKETAIDEGSMSRESQTTYDNEAIVRNAYHTAEGNVLDYLMLKQMGVPPDFASAVKRSTQR